MIPILIATALFLAVCSMFVWFAIHTAPVRDDWDTD